MTIDERISKLDPKHHHFEQIVDPWHMAVLVDRYPAVETALREFRIVQCLPPGEIHGGPIYQVWYSCQRDGTLIGEWGFDDPPNHLNGTQSTS